MSIFQSPKKHFPEESRNSAERAIFTTFQAPNFENSEPENKQFHTPTRLALVTAKEIVAAIASNRCDCSALSSGLECPGRFL